MTRAWLPVLGTCGVLAVASVGLFVHLDGCARFDEMRETRRTSAVQDEAALAVDGAAVRTIEERVLRWFMDFEALYRIGCDEAVFDGWRAEQMLPPAEPALAAAIAVSLRKLAPSWRASLNAEPSIFASTYFEPNGRGPDGDYAACWFDRSTGTMYLWLKRMF